MLFQTARWVACVETRTAAWSITEYCGASNSLAELRGASRGIAGVAETHGAWLGFVESCRGSGSSVERTCAKERRGPFRRLRILAEPLGASYLRLSRSLSEPRGVSRSLAEPRAASWRFAEFRGALWSCMEARGASKCLAQRRGETQSCAEPRRESRSLVEFRGVSRSVAELRGVLRGFVETRGALRSFAKPRTRAELGGGADLREALRRPGEIRGALRSLVEPCACNTILCASCGPGRRRQPSRWQLVRRRQRRRGDRA